ncbi:PTS N-acetyl glucosamine transporter subunit IIABC [Pontibacillus yanchengensis]|uniref:PTS N-acetyl glucosamine transporter subunit IIABC n=2 Tax=Pontibacillus yanchengensis TaxID=462910 RepID=A0ACC7VCN9_9BACI|nr:N-acetylglucosamine-specific PTS transporter subunit IIBC [Pontibacillus yanchengensis]MYL35399.1 PTS N-acetyl glucosamine transporter subunit IIABC [Pontibacillus yanchengensis]MYL52430.1 PTS N-acetyl glucosamine transporter subunit IIABC [Pontibacillus yanchengensis]
MLNFLQRIGKALMLPIALLPAAGLLLRLGQDDFLGIPFMAAAGGAIFDQLPLLFAIGVAIGMSKDGHGAAGLAGAIGYFVLQNGAQSINEDINISFLGGILSGVIAGLLYNKYGEIKLPDWLAFFGGKRFVPIVTAGTMIVLAGIFGVIWPTIQDGINALGQWIIDAGALGVGIYGFLNRLLIPVGLHHVLNSFVWFVFGDYQGATGDLNRFFEGDPEAGIFMAGFFPIMMFGLPAAALAMIVTAKENRRKATAGMLGGIALTSFITGITEPIEFSFMFLSPLLYGVHALLTGLSMVVAYVFDMLHGFTFSAGAIDYVLNFGLAQKPLLLLLQGLVFGAIYFVVFYFLIIKLNLQTPGREEEDFDMEEGEEPAAGGPTGGDKFENMAAHFMQDLGGKSNIKSIDYCATRLRLAIHDIDQVAENKLRKHGANGVMKVSRTNIQVVVGTNVEFVANAMQKQLNQQGEPKPTDEVEEQSTSDAKRPLTGSDFVLPISGKVVPITEVPDDAFSQKMMGDGFAIEPAENSVVSPVDGEVTTVFPSKHAVGITANSGHEILIHVGLDTVKIEGEGFNDFVKAGDKVTKGQRLLEVDFKAIESKVPSIVTPIVFTNLSEDETLTVHKHGEFDQGTEGILEVK